MNQKLYGTKLTNTELLTMTGARPAPAGVMGLLTAALNRYSPREDAGRAKTKK